jgi:hypothetical protein
MGSHVTDIEVNRSTANVPDAEGIASREQSQTGRRMFFLLPAACQCAAKPVERRSPRQDPFRSDALLGPLSGRPPLAHEVPNEGQVSALIDMAGALERAV